MTVNQILFSDIQPGGSKNNPSLRRCQADKDECFLREQELTAQLKQQEQEYLKRVEELSAQLLVYKGKPSTHKGCYTDPTHPGKELLRGKRELIAEITIEKCDQVCREFTYYGIQHGTCFCGNSFQAVTSPVPDKECSNFLCSGNKSQNCGANYKTSLYMRDS